MNLTFGGFKLHCTIAISKDCIILGKPIWLQPKIRRGAVIAMHPTVELILTFFISRIRLIEIGEATLI